MKRLILLSLITLISSDLAFSQPTNDIARHIAWGPNLPGSCRVATGDIFFKTTATVGAYSCGPTNNNWTAMTGGTVTSGFDTLLTGTNTGATMTVGTGATITFSGSGVVNASSVNGVTLGTTTATAGNLLIGSGTAWVTRVVSGDITISSTGVVAIGALKVTNAMLAGSIDLASKVTGLLPSANIAAALSSQTSINGLTITASTGTLTIANGITLTGPPFSATVATLGLTNTFTGRQDASGAASTAPVKAGTTLPATCIAGKDLFFKTDATAGQNFYFCLTTDTWTQQLNSGGSAGTVTTISFTGGLISVANPTTTPALTVAGTSGGIVYFSSSSTWASSGVLGANLPLFGGGAGASPIAGTRSGNTTAVVTTIGTQTSGNCVSIDASGNHVANGAACLTAADLAGIYLALGTDSQVITGVNISWASSATEASLVLTGAAIPSSCNAGGIGTYTTGRFFNCDGTNVQFYISVPGSGLTAPTAPSAGVAHFAGSVFTVTSSAVVSADLNITGTTCTNQFVSAISSAVAGTCSTVTLAGAQFANQGTTTTVLHGNAAGNPSFGAIVNGDITNATIGAAKMAATTFDAQTDAATITWAIASVLNAQATVTLGGNRTLNITNPVVGGNYFLKVTQDGTGSRTLTKGSGCTWKELGSSAATFGLSTAASTVDILTFTYDGTNCYVNVGKDYK